MSCSRLPATLFLIVLCATHAAASPRGPFPASGERSGNPGEVSSPPPAPALVSPAPGATGVSTAPTFVWRASDGASSYQLQAGTDSLFAAPAADDSLLADTVRQVGGLAVSSRYYWRVRGKDASGSGPWSAVRSFMTGSVPSVGFPVRASWNLISIPVLPADSRASVLFPDALSGAFSYDPVAGYQQRDTLVPGGAYWIKFRDSGDVALSGAPILRDTIPLRAGWNLLGTIASEQRAATIIQDPPGVLVSGFFAYAGGYTDATTLEPGKGYWVKAGGPGILILSSSGAMATVHSGEATYYTWADGSGNCMFDPTPDDLMVGAMNQTDYDNSAICGSCATVTGPDGTIDIRIVDRCPECAPGDIDLSPHAFSLIADTARGRVPISWHLRPCDVAGPIAYHFKDGSSQWWTAVQIRNHRNPVAQLEYAVSPGVWKTITRAQYNYFVESGMGPGPYTFRVTDLFGNTLIDSGIPLVPNATIQGTGQFP